MTAGREPAGPRGGFPLTRHSIVGALAGDDAPQRTRARAALAEAYWKPVYAYVRFKWRAGREEAEDLTQGFFAAAFEKDRLERYDPARARFRTFLRTCVDGHVQHERERAARVKRGGAVEHLPLDFETADGEFRSLQIADGADPDRLFDREWVRSLVALAVEDLRAAWTAAGRETAFRVFERYDVLGPDETTPPTYRNVAAELDIAETQVTNHLHAARRAFRAALLERLRALTVDEREFADEARELFGIAAP